MGGVPKHARLVADRERLQRALRDTRLVRPDGLSSAELAQFLKSLKSCIESLDKEIADGGV